MGGGVQEALNLIQRPFAAEKKSGYTNETVFGGLDRFVISHGKRLMESLAALPDATTKLAAADRLINTMAAYGQAAAAERARLLDEVERLLADLAAPSAEARHQEVTRVPVRNDGENLSRPVTEIPGVAKSRAAELGRLGLCTVEDVLYHLPRRYDDMSRLSLISAIAAGTRVTVCGKVLATKEARARSRRGLLITKAVIGDESGQLNLVWFGSGWRTPSPLLRRLRDAEEIIVHGEAEVDGGVLQVKNPTWDVADKESLHIGRVVPVYAGTGKLPAKILRRIVHQAVESFADEAPALLPEGPGQAGGQWSLGPVLRAIHAPSSLCEAQRARRQLCLEEVYLLQVALQRRRSWRLSEAQGIAFGPGNGLADQFVAGLPFKLTAAQQRVLDEVYQDMARPVPMERLVLGDVGSGKTVVAAAALLRAVENGYQGALMAPTEILAEQHYATFRRLCERLAVRVELLTGGAARRSHLAGIEDGQVDIVIGTHALIQGGVRFRNLGLVVADEQHRFGVRQRQLLAEKGQAPDVLIMSATPIPRTMALTVYGDLEVSLLDGVPPGRKPVTTKWAREDARSKVYDFVRKQLDRGHQAYLVCPLVEDSDELEAKAAVSEAERLASSEFRGYSVGLLHGQLASSEKEEVMRRFRDGSHHLLVATSVVEVGVDVPNATVMVVENAERFGLAQLHQLRGRVGRGEAASYCILISEGSSVEARRRLTAMTELSDGFKLAEEDLALRGPGEFFGTRQSGLPELRLPVAELLGDPEVVRTARDLAARVLGADPALQEPRHSVLTRTVQRRFGEVLPVLS